MPQESQIHENGLMSRTFLKTSSFLRRLLSFPIIQAYIHEPVDEWHTDVALSLDGDRVKTLMNKKRADVIFGKNLSCVSGLSYLCENRHYVHA